MIDTKRLILRPFKEKDFEETYSIYKNEEVCSYLLHEPWNIQNARCEFQKKLNNHQLDRESRLDLAVVINQKVIGDVSVWFTEMKETVEIGYSFDVSAKGKGLAAEACRALVEWLFNEKKVHRIQATLDARNSRSAKLCERIGMRKEAHFIQDFWNKGEWTDSFVYGMLLHDLNK